MPGPSARWAVVAGGGFYADHGSGYEFINISKPSQELARLAARVQELEADSVQACTDVVRMRTAWQGAKSERDALRARVERLTGALGEMRSLASRDARDALYCAALEETP
jgi:outer membrane murein-binding lipoprotein Lpp